MYSQTRVQQLPLGPEKRKRGMIKVRFRLVIEESNWPLLTGGRCSEVVVKASLTVKCVNAKKMRMLIIFYGLKVAFFPA